MADYKKMYHTLLLASEEALAQLERGEAAAARELLIAAERAAEDIYIDTDDGEEG